MKLGLLALLKIRIWEQGIMKLTWSFIRGFTVDLSVNADGKGHSQESTPKYRYGLLKSDTLNALTITIYGFGSIWGSVSKDTKKCFG